MTLEELQAEVLRLEGELQTVTAERDSLLQENETTKNTLEEARTLNQKLFLEVRQSTVEPEAEEDEPDVPTLEEFAKTLHL